MNNHRLSTIRMVLAVLLFSTMLINAGAVKVFANSELTVSQNVEKNRAAFKVNDAAASNLAVTIFVMQKQTNSVVYWDQAVLANGEYTFITLLPKGEYTGFISSASSDKVMLQDFSVINEEKIVRFRPLKAIAVEKGANVVVPSTVIAVFDDGANREVGVQWTDVPKTDTSGQYTITGKVNGSSETVRLVLNVGDSNPGGDPGSNPGGSPGGDPGSNPGGNPGGDPGSNPGGNPGGDPGSNPGGNPGGDPGNNPGGNPGGDPGSNPGGNPGGDPGSNPGSNPGGDPGSNPGGNSGGDTGSSSEDDTSGNIGSNKNSSTTTVVNNSSLAVTSKYDSSTSTVKAEVTAAAITSAFANTTADIKGVKTVTITLDKVDGAKVYEPTIPASVLSQGDKNQIIKINTPLGSVELPGNMVKASLAAAGSSISVQIGVVDKSTLADPKLREVIGDKPIVELNLKVDGKAIKWENKEAPVKVSLKYTPKPEELKNVEHIVIWYIDGAGKAVKVPNAKYNATTGMVTFSTTHFSTFAVSYDFKTFDDAGVYPWAQVPIEVLASKGIINGVTESSFRPSEKITRADFLLLLVQTLGITAEFSGNFSDVSPSDYYYEAVGIARKLGIAQGTGTNNFDPKEYISRQDLMVLSARALKIAGVVTIQGKAEEIQKFSDKSGVASYAVEDIAAMVKDGIVTGDGDLLHPQVNATRAETAAIMYRIFNKL